MDRPRVLLVEDDRMLRQFVRMALEELPIELQEADSVAAALPLLGKAPPQLLLTDLMMPGESGLDLLERMRRQPALRGSARIVVLSAGMNAEMRRRLEAYDIWRLMLKPVSAAELERCVREALADAPPAAPAQHREAEAAPASPGLSAPQAEALASYFGGNRALFDTYRERCRAQFPLDAAAADQALARGDLQALRLLAHSLKTVLRTLGHGGAELAHSLESACHAGQADAAQQCWGALRAQLLHPHL